ncbi:PilZ domain-containing protein, partial [Klebsiella pneumoniae]|uniref:PilZ domain-containing protein n=1 Tax=Klebsiella pneumoniae TaxID=573 RepID=UPI003853074B
TMATSPASPSRVLLPRRSERRGISAKIQYRRSTVRMAGVTLDLSCHGVRLAAMERLRVGETLWITLPGLPPRRASVIWV